MLSLVAQKTDRTFLDDMLHQHTGALEQVVNAYTRDIEQHVPIHPEYAASVLDELAADDAVFTVDTGMCNVWAARYLTPNGRRRVIGSFVHGTMANALPHAIGAQFAYPGRQVVSMSGDGGLGMLLGELLTVALAPAAGEDHRLQQLLARHGQAGDARRRRSRLRDRPRPRRLRGDRPRGRHPCDPDRAAGGRPGGDSRMRSPTRARRSWTSSPTPTRSRIPPHISGAQVTGFALAATKVVLSGGVGRMLELARSNLRNIPGAVLAR